MAISMTGFGRSKVMMGNTTVIAEVKTVNHRFTEYYFRMPRNLTKLEDKFKKHLSAFLSRGRVEVYITVEGEGLYKRKLSVDWDLLDQYFQYINDIEKRYSIRTQLSVSDLLNREELLLVEEREAGNEELEQLIVHALKEATLQCREMREIEGLSISENINQHVSNIRASLHQISLASPAVVEGYLERLKNKVQEFIGKETDETRLLQEVAILADKVDISEELNRLSSHIEQFVMNLPKLDPVGRKLDFLIQEMNREVNTIGSKANDAKIAAEVVELKSLLEKMKEQVQNIE